jgi:hypothetical protein
VTRVSDAGVCEARRHTGLNMEAALRSNCSCLRRAAQKSRRRGAWNTAGRLVICRPAGGPRHGRQGGW